MILTVFDYTCIQFQGQWKQNVLEIFLPFLLAGFGMVLAGVLLDSVQHWNVFQACPEIFILGPSMLNYPNDIVILSRFYSDKVSFA